MLQKNFRVVIKCLICSLLCSFFSCTKSKRTKSINVEIFSKTYPPFNYKIIGALIDGKKSGLWITYDSTGKVETEKTYVDGKSFGVVKLYTNGDLFAKSSEKIILNDTLADFEMYNPDGVVIVKGQYLNGQKKGIWLYYFNNGKNLKAKIDYTGTGIDTLYKSSHYLEDDNY